MSTSTSLGQGERKGGGGGGAKRWEGVDRGILALADREDLHIVSLGAAEVFLSLLIVRRSRVRW